MQRYRLKNNGLAFPNQSNPDWDRVAAGMAAPTIGAGQARRLAAGSHVKIRGSAQPGPSGALTAPISGEPCVWYRSYVQYTGSGIRPRPLPPAGRLSDIMLVAQPAAGLFSRYDNGDEISDRPFVVVDADGAAVTIDPRVADVHSDVLPRNRVVSSRFGFVDALIVEWIVPVGVSVFVLGTVGPGMDLDASAGAFQFVSTRSEQRIVERARYGHDSHASSAAMFRFVSRGARFSRALRTGSRIFLIVLAVAIVVAFLSLIIF